MTAPTPGPSGDALDWFHAVCDGDDRMLLATDAAAVVRYGNAAVRRGLGFTADQLFGKPAADLVPPDALFEQNRDALFDAARTGAPAALECAVARKDGEHFPARLTVTAVRDGGGELLGYLCAVRDLTDQHRYELALEHCRMKLAETTARLAESVESDPLTGLKNRAAFRRRLDDEFRRTARYKTPLGLLLIDVDEFRSYNDAFGHEAGDAALKVVAQTLTKTIRTIDVPCRYGGEEFAVALPNTDPDGAAVSAERVRAAVEAADWGDRPTTVSVGVASFCHDMRSAAVLIAAGESALGRAKAAGRNRVER